MNGGLGFFVEDCEIHYDPRGGVWSALAVCCESLMVPTLGTVLR